MRDIIYRLADGRLWQASKGEFLTKPVIAAANSGSGAAPVDDGDESAEGGAAVPAYEEHADAIIIDLMSAEGRSDLAYLAETLHASGFPLGELIDLSADALKEELARLDQLYLTPRVLASLAQGGDPIAQAKWLAHEVKAGPLREKLRKLEGESENGPDEPDDGETENGGGNERN